MTNQQKLLERRLDEYDRRITELERCLAQSRTEFTYRSRHADEWLSDSIEDMRRHSMEEMLFGQFGMNVIFSSSQARLNDEMLQLGVLAFNSTGTRDEVYLVETESRLTQEGIDRLLDTIAQFPRFFTDLKDRKIYGIIAAVDIPKGLQEAVTKRGLYLARIHDDTFKLMVPHNFQPTAFGPAASNGAGHTKKKARRKPAS